GCRARRRSSLVGDHSESRRVGSQTGEETGAGRATAGLLGGGSNRIRSVLAADRPGGEVRGGGPEPGTGQGGRPSEDRSAGRHEAGRQPSRGGGCRRLGGGRADTTRTG